MQSSLSISLLIFGVCLVEYCVSTEICSGSQYTVKDANGKFLKCQSCGECHEGYGLEPNCGSTVQSPVKNTYCKPCPSGTFSNKYDSSPCYQCQSCAKHQIVNSNCSSQSDTNCSRTCDSGYYFAKDASYACHECSYCCSDGKEEIQPECVKQGLAARNQHCSHRLDKNCGPEQSTKNTGNSEKQGVNKLGISLAITFGILGGVAVVALFIWALLQWKRRRSSDEGRNREQPREFETPMITVVGDTKDLTTFTSQENGNVVSSDADHAVLISNLHPTDPPRHPGVSKVNPGFVPSNPGTPRVSPNATPQHTDDELEPTPDQANVNRHRVKRQKSRGQIEIVQQPKSQKQTEGLRVEFTCGCKMEEKYEFSYQWLKDGDEFQKQNACSLVLDSVKMRDFGCYRCQVTRVGDESRLATCKSGPAVLEVDPRKGMRLKYLSEVDLDTQEKIATHLEIRTPSLGGWRQIAAKYGMEEHQIRVLVNARQPGQEVMDFLRGSNPDLTVYSFCKTLKEDNMKRFDIVKLLEGHLSIKKEGT